MMQDLDVHLVADHHQINIILVLIQQQVCDLFSTNLKSLTARVYTWE